MSFKHSPLIILIILTLSLLAFSDSLIQYNKEELFLSNSSLQKYSKFVEEFESKRVVLGYLETTKPEIIENALDDLKEMHPDMEYAWAKDFIGQSEDQKIREFYDKNKELSIQLIDSKGHYFIISHENMPPRELNEFFNHILEKMPMVSLIGPSFTNYHLNLQSLKIKELVFPILFVFSFIFILLAIRSFIPALYIFFISLFSVGLTLSLTKLFFSTSNMVTAIAPLVSFVITLAVSFHFYFSALIYKSKDDILKWKLRPFLLMIVTTVVGFASLRLSHITAVKQFALLSSFSILLSSLFAIGFWIYFLNRISPNKLIRLKKIDIFLKKPKRSMALIFCFLGIGLGSASFFKIPLLVEAAYFLPEGHIVRTSLEKLHHDFLGNPNLEIIINKKSDEYSTLQEIEKIEDDLLKIDSSINNIASMNSIVKDINYIYSKEKKLPEVQIAYQALLSKSPEILSGYKNYENHYRLTVYGKLLETSEYFKFIDKVKKYLDRAGIDYEFNGIYYHLMSSQKNLIETLIKSFLTSLILVCLIVAFSFKSISDFFIFILVNIGPPALSLIFLYLIGFSMNVATIMTFSVSFGMIVDSTIHILFAIENKEELEDYKISTLMPILYVSLLLIFSFLIIGLNEFLPIRQFGILMGVTLFFGLIFDLYIVPVLKTKNT